MTTMAPPTTAPVTKPAKDRTGLVIGGSMLAVIGSVLALGGGGVLALAGTDGTFESGKSAISTSTSALVSEGANITDTAEVTEVFGKPEVRVNAQAEQGSPDVFVGIGPKADVDKYLAGAPIEKVTDFDVDPFTLDKQVRSGDAKPKPPTTQSFWVAESSGRTANVDWKISDGNYKLVVMNADGSKQVATDASFDLEVPHLSTIALAALLAGILVIGGGVAMLVPSLRSTKS
jgi:hypothetical protein